MKVSRLLASVAVAGSIAGSAHAQTYTFNVQYFGNGVSVLAPGSPNDPLGVTVQPGESFLWTIQAMNNGVWHVVDNSSGFFTFMAFPVSESADRTFDMTLTLFHNGVQTYQQIETGSTEGLVHMGTNGLTSLPNGTDFDFMQLSYSFLSSVGIDYDPVFNTYTPNGTTPGGTISSRLPIFGPPENNGAFTGITYGVETVTPEPATVALVASGLLVMGGVARRRRDRVG